ncbi:M81 family metallopeptidase [Psychromarinibacter halotolerans]|uniref:M81 family metallopeptidase n=1 Tax=Psychromarinibacter halotolerans TaxID=1775175 RepID=A0ABV7GTV6_9RHOB|nr:M81 family metallopeptidase [Psychromarinibacter halotolerans]MDF0594804.1 M81 family metallopeptidase [Psychromarinibacter halotolerans]
MATRRIAIVGLSVEALVGSPLKTDEDAMQIYRGDELPANNLWLVRGVLARLAEEPEFEAVPLMWATALPGGALTHSNYVAIRDETVKLLTENGPFDGVVVCNHGALEVDGLDVQADADFVAHVREAVGPDMPIGVALDLHGHLSQQLLDAATVFSVLRTAPHRDDKQTGYRAAHMLVRTIKQGLTPKTAAVHIPILVSGEQAITTQVPGSTLYATLPGFDSVDGVMEANIFVGFAFNDRPWTGMSAVVTSDGDAAVAQRVAEDLAQQIWDARDQMILRMETDAVAPGLLKAAQSEQRPVYVSDSGDNTTAGAPGDLTHVLQEILRDDRLGDSVVAGIYAPKLVAKANEMGVGASIAFDLGAEHISEPVETMAVEGEIVACGPELVLGGFQPYRSAEGAWCVIRFGDVFATFHDLPIGITTPRHFEAMGIDPVKHAYYVVKLGYLHPQIIDIAKRHILLLTPGTVSLDLGARNWTQVVRPAFPADENPEWSAKGQAYSN